MTTLTLTRDELIDLGMAVSAAATSSYLDERLLTAAAEYKLAAKIWGVAGYAEAAGRATERAAAATREHAEAKAEAFNDAEAE